MLGKTGLLYAALYDAGFTAVMSTFGIWLMSREGGGSGWRDLVRSPMMWGVVLGVV